MSTLVEDADADEIERIAAAAGHRREQLSERLVIPLTDAETLRKALRAAAEQADEVGAARANFDEDSRPMLQRLLGRAWAVRPLKPIPHSVRGNRCAFSRPLWMVAQDGDVRRRPD